MRVSDKEPSNARRCAQLRQQIRLAGCVHPESASVLLMLHGDGFVEYCTDCMKVTDVHDVSSMR